MRTSSASSAFAITFSRNGRTRGSRIRARSISRSSLDPGHADARLVYASTSRSNSAITRDSFWSAPVPLHSIGYMDTDVCAPPVHADYVKRASDGRGPLAHRLQSEVARLVRRGIESAAVVGDQ